MRALLAGGIGGVRRFGAGGLPAADAPVEQLTAYALRMRATMETAAERMPLRGDVEVAALTRAPVPGRVVVDAAATATAERPIGGKPRPLDDAPPWAGVERVVLHLHGGVYCLGSSATHRGLGAALSRSAGAAVVLPDYRLAPEHPFPAALDDAVAVYRWLVETCGVPASRLAVSGDSAGGGLAAALLVRAAELGLPQPACYVGLSPWTDLAGTGRSMVERAGRDPWLPAGLAVRAAEAYAGDVPLDDPLVSPLYAQLTALPPVLVHVGSEEILFDDATRFVAACRAHGVDASLGCFPGLWHVFHLFPGVPEARHALHEIGGFIRRHTGAATDHSVAAAAPSVAALTRRPTATQPRRERA